MNCQMSAVFKANNLTKTWYFTFGLIQFNIVNDGDLSDWIEIYTKSIYILEKKWLVLGYFIDLAIIFYEGV